MDNTEEGRYEKRRKGRIRKETINWKGKSGRVNEKEKRERRIALLR